ncbi:uncharacterized protein RG961_015023 [Leptosomus discolor]
MGNEDFPPAPRLFGGERTQASGLSHAGGSTLPPPGAAKRKSPASRGFRVHSALPHPAARPSPRPPRWALPGSPPAPYRHRPGAAVGAGALFRASLCPAAGTSYQRHRKGAGSFRSAAAMEEAGSGHVRLSRSWRRDELRRLRRLRRRFTSDPLLARLPPVDRSPTARRPVVRVEPVPEGKWLLGTAATHRRGKARTDICSHLSFWKRIAGIVIAVAVILLLTWITLNPLKLPHLEPCPDDWLYYKKKCYYHSAAMADWNSGQESCSAYGASLAVIDSHQELNFIMYRIRVTDFWIGLRRKGNKFFWVNGESFDRNLFHINITNDGDCVHIDSAFISTRSCSSFKNWLCTIGQFNPKTSSQ